MFLTNRAVIRLGGCNWLFNLIMNAIIWPKLSLIMKEILSSILIDEITGESRYNTACYTEGSGYEVNNKLLSITFYIIFERKSISHVLICDSAIVGSRENGSYEALKAKYSEGVRWDEPPFFKYDLLEPIIKGVLKDSRNYPYNKSQVRRSHIKRRSSCNNPSSYNRIHYILDTNAFGIITINQHWDCCWSDQRTSHR